MDDLATLVHDLPDEPGVYFWKDKKGEILYIGKAKSLRKRTSSYLRTSSLMRILHILDHSLPLQSGYTFRSRNIFREQRALGWETFHLTGPKQALNSKITAAEENVDNLLFYRTDPAPGVVFRSPVANQIADVHALKRRLREVVKLV